MFPLSHMFLQTNTLASTVPHVSTDQYPPYIIVFNVLRSNHSYKLHWVFSKNSNQAHGLIGFRVGAIHYKVEIIMISLRNGTRSDYRPSRAVITEVEY